MEAKEYCKKYFEIIQIALWSTNFENIVKIENAQEFIRRKIKCC